MSTVNWNGVHVDVMTSYKTNREIVNSHVISAKKMGLDEQIMICNLGDIISKYKRWIKLMPRVKPFYAVKCNDDRAVLKVLADCGASFDCASKDEIKSVLSLGVEPSRIIYAHTCKQPSMLKYATDNDVTMLTFDNEAELFKIKSICPDAKLLLRTIPAGDFESKIDLRFKFGCPLTEVRPLLQKAKELQLNVIGISFHVGSGCTHPNAYAASIRQSRDVFDMASSLGFQLKLLDIGGGYPGASNTGATFVEIAKAINAQLDIDFPPVEGVDIIAEPGTYIASSSSTLAVNIIGKRILSKRDECGGDDLEADDLNVEEQRVMYYVNDGVYGSFQDILVVPENLNLTANTLMNTKDNQCYESTVWGPTCCGFDCVIKSAQLPMLEVGDWFYFTDMGAYTIVFSPGFNGMSPPRRVYYCVKDIWDQLYPSIMIGEEETITNGYH